MAIREAVTYDARYSRWLIARERGVSSRLIAREYGVSVRTVQIGVALALERRAETVERFAPKGFPHWTMRPLLPIGALTPTSKCPHNGPIAPGSGFVCVVCHQSGADDDPRLRRDPATDPRPEPKPPTPPPPKPQTRKEKRKNWGWGW